MIKKTPMKKLIFLSFALFFTSSLHALKNGGHVKASLVSEVETIQPGHSFTLAVKLEMAKDWHTYWINPAESGAPTRITWDLPEGLTAGPIQWPAPKKIVVPPVTTYGYEKGVWLLNDIKVSESVRPEKNITIKARVDWLECSVECVPGQADVSITLPVSDRPMTLRPQLTEKFSKARMALPLISGDWQFAAARTKSGFQISMKQPTWMADKLSSAEFFSDAPSIVDYAAKQNFREAENGTYILDIPKSEIDAQPAIELTGVIQAEPGWRGKNSEKAIQVQIPLSTAPINTNTKPLFIPLLFAFLGGLLLNLMPCVLPVLSIKALGFIRHGAEDATLVKKQSYVFALGVVASFWLLSGLLLFLRAGGQQLGWGFQMQSPPFVYFLVTLFFLMGLNLLGVFEVGTSLTQLGTVSNQNKGWMGSFLSGALTTLVATPCTAPFMGSALGYAISQPPTVAFGIFTSLGLGVAAPYVVLSSFPKLISYLPKPGDWMEILKQFMGFLMMATVLWLLWVLDRQRQNILLPIFATLLIQGLGAWVYGRWGSLLKPKQTRVIATGVFLGLLLFAMTWGWKALAEAPSSAKENVIEEEGKIAWEPFSPEAVSKYRKLGQPVFVDFTAGWCLTCQVNERVALNSGMVIKKFHEKNLKALKADWTSYDPQITAILQSYGRNGVPFYLLYSSKENEAPKPLPEILTPQIVLDALNKTN